MRVIAGFPSLFKTFISGGVDAGGFLIHERLIKLHLFNRGNKAYRAVHQASLKR